MKINKTKTNYFPGSNSGSISTASSFVSPGKLRFSGRNLLITKMNNIKESINIHCQNEVLIIRNVMKTPTNSPTTKKNIIGWEICLDSEGVFQ